MDKPAPSFQELVRRRQQTAFVGRETEVDAFLRNLSAPLEERALLVSISGQGGMGKTFLARQFASLAAQHGFVVGWSDESETDAVDVMAALAHDLGEQRFKTFFDGERTYRARRHELESDPDVPAALIESLGDMLGRGGVRLARHAPGVGMAFELVSEETAAEAGRQAASAASYIARKLKDKDEAELVSDPLHVLTPRFVDGLARVGRDRGILLVFDTFEATRLTVQPWLRELLAGTYGELPGNLMIVLAGRDPLDSNVWADYESVVMSIAIEAFGPEAAHTYLARHGITDPEIVAMIVELAQGLPLLLATFASRSPTDAGEMGDAADTATERFLKWLANDEHRQIALRGSIPRAFDQDVLAVLLGDQTMATTALEWLRQQPFVTQRRDGWRYHDLVRSMLGTQLRRESQQAWKEAHERMAEAFRTGPRKDAIEATYHAVAADPGNLGAGVSPLLAAWRSDDPRRALAVARAMRQGQADAGADDAVSSRLVDALSQVESEAELANALEALVDAEQATLDADARIAIHLLVALTNVQDDRERARRHARAALDTGRLPMAAHAINAMVAMWDEQWEIVKASSERALALAADQDNPQVEMLAVLHSMRAAGQVGTGNDEAAIEEIEAAMALQPDDGHLHAAHAAAAADRGDHRAALEEFEHALELGVTHEHVVRESIARLRGTLGEPDLAESYLRALESDPDCVACWTAMARELGSVPPEQARRMLTDAPRGDGMRACYGRALALGVIGEAAEAIELLDAHVVSDDAFPDLLVLRATIHARQGDEEQAAELLRRAEAASDSDAALANVMTAHRRIGNAEGVERCATVLLSRSEEEPGLRLVRAEARRMRGDLDGAHEDLRAADEVDTDDAQVLEWRALLARDLGEHDRALASARAWGKALDGTDEPSANALNRLGLLLSHLGRWDDALARIAQSLEREPDDLAARYNRLVALARRDGAEPHADEIEQLRQWIDARESDAAPYAYAKAGIAALVGDADTALDGLASACARSTDAADWAQRDRAFDDVRADRRFEAAVRTTRAPA